MRYDPSRLRIMNEDDYNEAVDWMKLEVSTFVENSLYITGKVPDLDDFIERCPMYDKEILYPEITKHINKIAEIIQKEMAK